MGMIGNYKPGTFELAALKTGQQIKDCFILRNCCIISKMASAGFPSLL